MQWRHPLCFQHDRFTRSGASPPTIKGYYGSNYRSHVAAASTPDKVTYTITPTATQSFLVYARWVAQATNATNASYTIAPNTANNLTVTLSAQGNGIVIADAIKIVPATAKICLIK